MRETDPLPAPPTPTKLESAPTMALARFADGRSEWLFTLDPRLFLRDPQAPSQLEQRIALEEIYAAGPKVLVMEIWMRPPNVRGRES